jgi:hypothetical protein
LSSPDLDKIDKISLNAEFFAIAGCCSRIPAQLSLYKLPDLKKQLLAEATADAVARAKEISGSAKTGWEKCVKPGLECFRLPSLIPPMFQIWNLQYQHPPEKHQCDLNRRIWLR